MAGRRIKLVFVRNNALADAANTDYGEGLAIGAENTHRAVKIALGDNDHVTNAHIEDAVHFIAIDAAAILDVLENRRNFPRSAVDFGVHALRQNARNIIDKTAACNVRHAVNFDLGHKRGNRLEEAAVNG